MIGPAIGYILGGRLLALYTDFDTLEPGVNVSLTTNSPLWVGAWWLGFLITWLMAWDERSITLPSLICPIRLVQLVLDLGSLCFSFIYEALKDKVMQPSLGAVHSASHYSRRCCPARKSTTR